MKLIVGLGNPGKRYENTRHNVGFQIIREFACRQGAGPPQEKFEAETVRLTLGNQQVMLLCPLTYMNLSGRSIRQAANFYKLPLEELLVICDDFNLPVGKLRSECEVLRGGSRVCRIPLNNWVARSFADYESVWGLCQSGAVHQTLCSGNLLPLSAEMVAEVVDRACKAIDCWCTEGIEQSMNNFN